MSKTTARKLGCRPRAFDPTMPHMMAVRMMLKGDLPPVPDKVNYLDGLPDDLGMMLNDQLGCCTCAAIYHYGQVASFHGRRKLLTEPDKYILSAYEEFCGYQPGNPSTDQGGVEQEVLRKWLQNGAPIQEGYSEQHPEPGRSYLKAAMEVLPRNIDYVKRAIYDCGGIYIGFDVPAWLMEQDPLPEFWDGTSNGRNSQIVGGHAVSCNGYDDRGVFLISWGRKYQMSWNMWREVVSEAYALVHPWWIEATGQTPFGLPLEQLIDQMGAFTSRRVA